MCKLKFTLQYISPIHGNYLYQEYIKSDQMGTKFGEKIQPVIYEILFEAIIDEALRISKYHKAHWAQVS